MEIRNPRGGPAEAWAQALVLARQGTAWRCFHGRLVGDPEHPNEEVVTLNFVAKTHRLRCAKEGGRRWNASAFPSYDPLWIADEMREDADVVLEARPCSGTRSGNQCRYGVDLNAGEDGTIDLGGDSSSTASRLPTRVRRRGMYGSRRPVSGRRLPAARSTSARTLPGCSTTKGEEP